MSNQDTREKGRPETKFSPRWLQGLGIEVRTIIDVGVHRGTPELYKAFSRSKLVLVDPAPGFADRVRERFPKLDMAFHQVAAGAVDGVAEFSLAGAASTLNVEAEGVRRDVVTQAPRTTVAVRRLDALVAHHGYAGPFGIKIDAEGSEIDVLRGADGLLPATSFVIAELTVRRRFENDYRVSDVVAWLARHDLEFMAVLNDKPGYQRHYDCLFVRRNQRVLAGKSPAAPPPPTITAAERPWTL